MGEAALAEYETLGVLGFDRLEWRRIVGGVGRRGWSLCFVFQRNRPGAAAEADANYFLADWVLGAPASVIDSFARVSVRYEAYGRTRTRQELR